MEWTNYKNIKPSDEGWYLCIVRYKYQNENFQKTIYDVSCPWLEFLYCKKNRKHPFGIKTARPKSSQKEVVFYCKFDMKCLPKYLTHKKYLGFK